MQSSEQVPAAGRVLRSVERQGTGDEAALVRIGQRLPNKDCARLKCRALHFFDVET
jgi:hypothetical protein